MRYINLARVVKRRGQGLPSQAAGVSTLMAAVYWFQQPGEP